MHRSMPRPARAAVSASLAALIGFSAAGGDGASLSRAIGQPEAAPAERVRNAKEWNLPSGRRPLAIQGYDPVAYFPEGGGEAKEGEERFNLLYRGITYNFTSAENRDRFRANPARYEPAFGGWCAWAMSRGTKTEADPKSFIVKDDRLYVFYKGLFADTRKDWKKGDHRELSDKADREWNEISGEEPRNVPAKNDGDG